MRAAVDCRLLFQSLYLPNRHSAFLVLLLVAWLPGIGIGSAYGAEPGDVIDVITVTARKMPEDLFDVPLSVQVVRDEFLDLTAPTNLYELQYDVPGLVVTNGGMFGAGIALRGVTDTGGGTLAVAPHMNGVYLGTSAAALTRLFDVQRIEVLKGPQGTLYGRNATGGSINVITRLPEYEFSAEVETARGSFDTTRVTGYLNLPAEGFAVRLAMTAADGDGYIRNTADERLFAEEDHAGLRMSLLAQPNDALKIGITAQHIEDDGASGDLWLPRKDFLPDPSDIHLTTVTLANPHLETRDDAVSADIGVEFGRVQLTLLSGYVYHEANALDDCAGIPPLAGCERGVHPDSDRQWSQEIRLSSTENGTLDWLLGVYWLDVEALTNFRLQLLTPQPLNDYSAASRSRAYALFGQATRALGEHWSLTGGLRFSREESTVSDSGSGEFDNPTVTTAGGAWNKTTWRFGLQYEPADGVLYYGSVATGFKSGGVTTELTSDGSFDTFQPENLLAYEAGINLGLPGRRWNLRANAFLYDFEDLQVTLSDIVDGRVVFVTENAAAARIHGVDITALVTAGDRLTLSAAAVWLGRREYVEFTTDLIGQPLTGKDLSRAPEWTVTASAAYTQPLRAIGELTVRADYGYRSHFFFTPDNGAVTAQDAFGLLNLYARLDSTGGRWYLFGSARNVLDKAYFNQVFLQSAPGLPANYEAGFGLRF